MATILIVVLLIVLFFGGGGSYYAFNTYGPYGGGISLLGAVLVFVVILWAMGRM
jgi:hypothetical protein